MAESSQPQQDLITLGAYLKGWLSLSWRLPSIFKNIWHINHIGKENRESWGLLLESCAARFPENAAVKSDEGTLTYGEYNARVNRVAHYFLSQGIGKGDTVAVFMENRQDLLVVYSALAKIGAVNAMINTNLRRDSLLHCLTLNPAKAFMVGEEITPAFEEVRGALGLTQDQGLYSVPDRGTNAPPPGFTVLTDAVQGFDSQNPSITPEVKPDDVLAYVFTSGTTGGMPKAAVVTHGRVVSSCYYNGRVVLNMKPSDTIYVPLPFFHTNALALSWPGVFSRGSAIAIRRKFSVSRFWDDVRKYHATMFCYVGELCRYLMNRPPTAEDRNHPLRTIIGNGLRPDTWRTFKERFGIEKVYEIYGAAESNIYFVNLLNLDCTVGTSRMPYAIVRYDIDEDRPVRGKDGFLQKVGRGEVGLILGQITNLTPFRGYTSKEATESKILRDVFEKGDAWFNTGDLVRDLGFRHIQFVDRLGDTFRWKGENVSTTEVEKVANAFDQVAISASYGVMMPGGDGRAGMVAVIPEQGEGELDFEGMAAHFQRELPSYAVPKFIRIRKDFDYTPTHKIKKLALKKEGFDPGVVPDPLYVLLPGEDAYRPLTPEIHREIMEGKYRF
ncbi:MAG: long-chain-acyl-CoA synthetase [Deltaproteobacteria bacterium]|nr:MAG: long-chain-acyl-CoA synthetase [Deltaproteobacteria bacterium]